MNLEKEMNEMYEQWLLDECPEDIRCKDDLIEKAQRGHRIREFVFDVQRAMMVMMGEEE